MRHLVFEGETRPLRPMPFLLLAIRSSDCYASSTSASAVTTCVLCLNELNETFPSLLAVYHADPFLSTLVMPLSVYPTEPLLLHPAQRGYGHRSGGYVRSR